MQRRVFAAPGLLAIVYGWLPLDCSPTKDYFI